MSLLVGLMDLEYEKGGGFGPGGYAMRSRAMKC